MSSILIRTAVLVLLLAVLGFGTGLLFGPGWGWSFFSLGLAGLLVHHVRHLNLLRQWASRSLTEAVPEGSGAWEEVFTLLYRRQRADAARSRQLAHSLARSRQAGRALPYGVAILDAEYRIVWCNDSCEAHFGIDAEADVGQPITNLVRQPEFVGYVAANDFSKPLQLKTARDGLVLSVQFVPYVDSQRRSSRRTTSTSMWCCCFPGSTAKHRRSRRAANASRSTPSRASTCSGQNPRSPAPSATSRATPCAIPHRGARSALSGAARRTVPSSQWKTPASASKPSTSHGSPNASTAWTAAARAKPVGRAWVSPSSSTPWRGTRRAWRSRARLERAAGSPPSFPRDAWCRRARALRRFSLVELAE